MLLLRTGFGCGHTRSDALRTGGVARTQQAAATSATATEIESDVATWARARQESVDTLLAAEGPYYVLIVRSDSGAALVTLAHESTGIRQIGRAVPVAGLPYPQVRLVMLRPRTALRVTKFDDLAENIVGTAVDRLQPDGVWREYADPSTVCKAADFREKGGGFRLRTYVDSPFSEDCLSPCAEELRRVIGFEPGRVVDLERTSGAWRRADADLGTRTELRQGYGRAVAALRAGTITGCSAESRRLIDRLTVWQAESLSRSQVE